MDERRDQIADGFKKYFHHYGFKKTSVDEVAGELHISKKTIYSYFDSKEAIFTYVIQREANFLIQPLLTQLENKTTLPDKITELIHLIFEQARLYLKTTRGLDFENQELAARLAFQSAYEEALKQTLNDPDAPGSKREATGELSLLFIKAVIWQGLEAFKANPDGKVEEQTGQAVLKLIS